MTEWVAGTNRLFALGVLAALLSVAAYLEIKEKRIPNWLTFPSMAIGLLCGYFPGGIPFGSALVGLVLGFGVFFIFFLFGGMGGGDVKLMGAVGALLGHSLVVPAMMYTALIGGVMGLGVLVWRWVGPKAAPADAGRPAAAAAGAGTIPYGVAIVCGCLLALFLHPG